MNRAYARSLATECFTNLYRRDQTTVGQYLAYCKGIRDRTVSDPEFEAQHLAHLELYERAEQLDFDEWTTDLLKTHRLVRYAVREGRCDIIEKYASRAPTTRAWNTFTSSQYQPCLYAVLHLVMPLPASMYDALEYVRRGLHLEVATHIIGRTDCWTGLPITQARVARYALCTNYALVPIYLNLEVIGLDLSDPTLLHEALRLRTRGCPLVRLLQSKALSRLA